MLVVAGPLNEDLHTMENMFYTNTSTKVHLWTDYFRSKVLPGCLGCRGSGRRRRECSSWSQGRPDPRRHQKWRKAEWNMSFLSWSVEWGTHLLQSLAGEMGFSHDQTIALCGEIPHLTVCGPVMKSHSRQVVKCLV